MNCLAKFVPFLYCYLAVSALGYGAPIGKEVALGNGDMGKSEVLSDNGKDGEQDKPSDPKKTAKTNKTKGKEKEGKEISSRDRLFWGVAIFVGVGVGALVLPSIGARQIRQINVALSTARNIRDSMKQLKPLDTKDVVRLRSMVDGLNQMELEGALVEAASAGNIKSVNLVIKLGAEEFDIALVEAARGGHTKVVRRMIELDAEEFDEAMISAAEGGHLNIVKMMIEQDAWCFEDAIVAAQKNGHSRLVKFLEKTLDEQYE